MWIRLRQPNHQQWGNDQSADRVAEPPRDPDGRIAIPWSETAQGQAGDADGGTNDCAQNRREQDKLENVPGSFKSFCALGKAVDRPSSQQRLDCIAGCDREGGCHRPLDGDVHQKGAKKNSRPNSISAEEKSRQCDPGRWPNRRGARVDIGQRKPQLASAILDRREPNYPCRCAQVWSHLYVFACCRKELYVRKIPLLNR